MQHGHEKLVMMANQIARFFAPQGEARAVPQIAKHLASFWDPRMRRGIREYAASGGAGLAPLARDAVLRLTNECAICNQTSAIHARASLSSVVRRCAT